MGRIEDESIRFFCPSPTNEFVWCKAFEGLQSSAELIGYDEVGEMLAELIVALIVKALDGRILDGAVHAFDLAIGPRMFRLGGSMFDISFGASIFEDIHPEDFACRHRLLDEGHG